MPTGSKIAPATASDAGAIARLHQDLFDEGWPEHSVLDLLREPTCRAFLAREARGGEVIGIILLRTIGEEAEILTLGVAKLRQGHGIAMGLLEVCLRDAADHGVAKVFLEVASDNRPARALYARYGFSQVGLRKQYYRRPDGNPCDAILLAVALPSRSP